MSHNVLICEIRVIRGQNFFDTLPWIAGEARVGKSDTEVYSKRRATLRFLALPQHTVLQQQPKTDTMRGHYKCSVSRVLMCATGSASASCR